MHACMHAYIHTYMHTYIHTHIHTYIRYITLRYVALRCVALRCVALRCIVVAWESSIFAGTDGDGSGRSSLASVCCFHWVCSVSSAGGKFPPLCDSVCKLMTCGRGRKTKKNNFSHLAWLNPVHTHIHTCKQIHTLCDTTLHHTTRH